MPKPPPGTSREVAAWFRRLAATLPQVTAADTALLLQLSEALWLEREAMRELQAGGLLTPDLAHGGAPKRNPALLAWRTSSEVVRACLYRMGGSPLDRQRLAAPAQDPSAELIGLLYGEPAP